MERIGRYQIIDLLGEGGMARVYRAYDPKIDREVAVKVLPKRYLDESTYLQRFEIEAQTIAGLEHYAIVSVYDYGEYEGRPYFVMRLMGGGSLAGRLRRGALSMAEIEKLIRRIGSALDRAHQQGIIHRDLKPANILYDDDGEPFLSDFGIVKLDQGETLTQAGGIIGTPAYMSPEQGMGQKLDARSDVYSLGVILYECATGRVPFKADTAVATVLKHVSEPLPSPKLYNPQLPESIVAVIQRSLAKESGQRFQSTGTLAVALKTAIDNPNEAQTMIDIAPVIPPSDPPPGGRPAGGGSGLPSWSWIVGLLLVLAIGIGGWFVVGGALSDQGNGETADLQATILAGTIRAEVAVVDEETPTPTPEPPTAINTPEPTATDTPPPTQTPVPPTPTDTPTPEGPYGRIVFVSDRGGRDELYMLDVQNPQNARQITQAPGSGWRDWWPDWCGENQVVFERGDDPWQSTVQEIAMVNVDSGDVHTITSGSMPPGSTFNGIPSCTRDDKTLAFTTYSSENDIGWAVGFVNLADGSPRFKLLGRKGYALAGNVSFSPDDRSVVLMHLLRSELSYHIYRIERDDPDNFIDLSGAFGGNNKYPDWSPDGKQVAFTCGIKLDGRHRWSLCLTPSDFSSVEVLLSEFHLGPERWEDQGLVRHALTPSWSPDGKYIAFAADRDGDFDIFIYSLEDGELINLTRDWPGDEIHPSWNR